jgi:oxygen-independent coproporphyrinogen-3 oxidase
VPAWPDGFGEAQYREALGELAARPPEPVSLYVHLPYCLKRCSYCGCNAAVPVGQGDGDRYLDALEREMDMVAGLIGRRHVVQMHWGGGTPNYGKHTQLRRTVQLVRDRFDLDPDGEFSLEADPRLGTVEQVHLLRELGFNRISMGVQDFDRKVQVAIGRVQPEPLTVRFYEACRDAGFASVNMDLVYGLPHQTVTTFRRTLDRVIELNPDRLAVFGYAHVPWARPNQATIDVMALPSGPERFDLYRLAVQTLTDAGYVWIGIDHFARPDDELSHALAQKRLHRNFMGYTTRPALDLIAVGNSSISDVRDRFAQNTTEVEDYEAAVHAGHLPVVKGMHLSEDDKLRRLVILHLMCNLELPFGITEPSFGAPVDVLLPESVAQLAPLEADGLVTVTGDGLQVTELGRYFLRNISMVFDAYLARSGEKPLFSRTV